MGCGLFLIPKEATALYATVLATATRHSFPMLPQQHQGHPQNSRLLFYVRNGETIIKLLQKGHWNDGEGLFT